MRALALPLALAAALASAGCVVTSEAPTGSVDLYWSFVRTTWEGTTLAYDPLRRPGGSGSGACAGSGVDTVVVTHPDGGQVVVPCVNGGSQGVALDGVVAGQRTFTLTGYRGATALYRYSLVVDVPAGPPSAARAVDVPLFGLYAHMDVFFYFASAAGVPIANATCASEGVDAFTFDVRDWAGTAVVSTTMFPGLAQPCSDAAPGPGVALNDIDLDRYTIRARAWRNGVALPIYDSCDTSPNTSAVWLHDGPDLGVNGWPVSLLYKSCP